MPSPPDAPDDAALLQRLEAYGACLGDFDRAVYAHARLRVLAGCPLKPAQRQRLHRVLTLLERLAAASPEEEPHA